MNLFQRVIAVATKPKEEWPVIAAETTTIGELYSKVVVILVAIGPVCTALNSVIFGYGVPFTDITIRPSMTHVFGQMILTYVFQLAGVFLMAFIVEKLAPSFQSEPNLVQAFKLITYSYAPFWLAGALHLIPFIGILTFIVGLYGIYLAYIGLPFLMKTPPDKAVPYLIVVIVISIVIWFVIGVITAGIVGLGAWSATATHMGG